MTITTRPRWSLGHGKPLVPSGWQATPRPISGPNGCHWLARSEEHSASGSEPVALSATDGTALTHAGESVGSSVPEELATTGRGCGGGSPCGLHPPVTPTSTATPHRGEVGRRLRMAVHVPRPRGRCSPGRWPRWKATGPRRSSRAPRASATPSTRRPPSTSPGRPGYEGGRAHEGRRYLTEGRVVLRHLIGDDLVADVRGDGTVHEVSFSPRRGWRCTCPALGRCCHLLAVGLVVALGRPAEAQW